MKMNNCRLMFVCFVAFSLLFIALPGFAKDSSLQVKCVDSSGNPAANIKVVIFNLNNQKMKDKKSDAQGIADFAKVDDGVYRIFGRKDGLVPALYEFVLLKESTESVTLKFESGADKKFYFEDQTMNQQAMGLMKEALDAYKQSKFADAEKLLMQSLEINPSNADALYYCSVTSLQQGKFDQGATMLNRTLQVSNLLKTLPSPVQPGSPNPYDQISQNVQQLLKRLPAIKGENALNQKKYDEAIALFSEAIKSDPENSEYYANLAIALTNAKKYDEGMAAVDKAIQMKPAEKSYVTLKGSIAARRESAVLDNAQTIMNEGNKLLQDGDPAGAIKKFEQASAIVAPERQSPLWRQIAKAQIKLNQPDAAIASYKKSIELAPADKSAEYRDSFAQYYLENKKYDEAVDVLADPKGAGSRSPEQVLLDLAKTAKNKEPKLAEAALERVIKTNPANAEAYFDLGQMYYADGKEKDNRTKELLTKFVEIGKDPDRIESAKNILIMVNRRTK
jgi:tetratricopeptide (TPR) repeat protein